MDGNNLLPPPVVKVPSDEQTNLKKQYEGEIKDLTGTVEKQLASIEYSDPLPEAALGDLKLGDAIWFDE